MPFRAAALDAPHNESSLTEIRNPAARTVEHTGTAPHRESRFTKYTSDTVAAPGISIAAEIFFGVTFALQNKSD